jgi:aminopeptidase N
MWALTWGGSSGSAASTEDFQKVVEKHVGIDMGWFFREWVYGTAVPSYKFAWKVGDPVDGKYKVTCRIEQSNVPDDFKMYVPIKIDFGNDKFARLRVLVEGKGAEFDLPLMPMKPEEVIFNDLNSVLCEVDDVSW